MRSRFVIAADIGTSSIKGCVAEVGDGKGARLRAFARAAFPPEELAPGKFAVAAWEQAFAVLVASLRSSFPNLGSCDALALSGNGPTLVPVLADGTVEPPLMWHDGRRLVPPGAGGPSLFLPKAAWYTASRTAEESPVAAFLSCPEYLAAELTGVRTTWLPTEAYRRVYWTDADARAFGIDPGVFPPFIPVGGEAGRVTSRAADRFGLPPGLPVFAGGPDFLTALVGTGTVLPGRTCDCTGTSEGLNACVASGYEIPAGAVTSAPVDVTFRLLPHAIAPYRNVSTILPATGRIFEWFRRISGQDEVPYDVLVARLAALPLPEAVFFFPDMRDAGSRLDSGSIFVNPGKSADRDELGRAVVEAIGCMVREGLEALALAGLAVSELRVSGGQAKNGPWCRLKADIAGISLAVPEIPDGELSGDICAALVGLGDASGLAEAAERVVRIARVYEPDLATRALRDATYGRWRELRSQAVPRAEGGRP